MSYALLFRWLELVFALAIVAAGANKAWELWRGRRRRRRIWLEEFERRYP
jgi:hypothetical protein